MEANLFRRCGDVNDPNRNLSLPLECSWSQGVNQAGIQDPRVIAVGAVSPATSLLFPRGAGVEMSARPCW